MYDTNRMRGVEHAHDRRENFKSLGGGKPSARFELMIQSVPFDILHHHVDRAVGCGAKIVNGYRIRMSKTTSRLTLAPEPSQPFGVRSNFRRKNFDGDTIAKQNMPRAIDCSHPAFAQQRFHLVLPVEH